MQMVSFDHKYSLCLWLDGEALQTGNMHKVLARLQEGLSSPEHAHFVAQLAKQKAAKTENP
jgi:hypothetical protein